MKTLFKNAKNAIAKVTAKVKDGMATLTAKIAIAKYNSKSVLANQRGDQNVSQAILILVAIVIGALLLAGLYMLFEDVILPTVTERVQEMFDYKG